MAKKLETYIGKGTVSLARLDVVGAPLLEVGDVPSLKLEWDTQDHELMNHQTAGGGTLDAYTEIKGGKLTMELVQFHARNMAMLTYGTQVNAAAQTGKSETLTAAVGGLLKFELIPKKGSIVVKDESGSTTYDAGADYVDTPSGIRILAGGTIVDGDKVKVTYDTEAQYTIEALAETGVEYRMVIEGLNAAAGGAPKVIDVHRIRFGPGGLDIITEGFGKSSLSGKMLIDTSKAGTGKSQYATIQSLA